MKILGYTLICLAGVIVGGIRGSVREKIIRFLVGLLCIVGAFLISSGTCYPEVDPRDYPAHTEGGYECILYEVLYVLDLDETNIENNVYPECRRSLWVFDVVFKEAYKNNSPRIFKRIFINKGDKIILVGDLIKLKKIILKDVGLTSLWNGYTFNGTTVTGADIVYERVKR